MRNENCRRNSLALGEKYMLTVQEASAYFSIGVKNMRRMAESNDGGYALLMGNKYMIVRHKFEAYIDELTENRNGGIADEQSGFED
ncbi:MAG: hypothetical protein HUJ69_01395 [Lachnospiraceae bacterium]|nr:hypothetical protein [Lachnospiraceae bacterium]